MSWYFAINKFFICLHFSAKYDFRKACRRILFSGFCKKLLNSFIPGKCLSFAGNTFFVWPPTSAAECLWRSLPFSLTTSFFIIIICSYSHRSGRMPSKYYFKNFVPIIFSCIDCPITFFSVSWRWCWRSPQQSHIYDFNIFGVINTFQIQS